MKMRPVKLPYVDSWEVIGLGYFNSEEEALEAIAQSDYTVSLRIEISPTMKKELERLAKRKDKTVSAVIREMIRKEIASD